MRNRLGWVLFRTLSRRKQRATSLVNPQWGSGVVKDHNIQPSWLLRNYHGINLAGDDIPVM